MPLCYYIDVLLYFASKFFLSTLVYNLSDNLNFKSSTILWSTNNKKAKDLDHLPCYYYYAIMLLYCTLGFFLSMPIYNLSKSLNYKFFKIFWLMNNQKLMNTNYIACCLTCFCCLTYFLAYYYCLIYFLACCLACACCLNYYLACICYLDYCLIYFYYLACYLAHCCYLIYYLACYLAYYCYLVYYLACDCYLTCYNYFINWVI